MRLNKLVIDGPGWALALLLTVNSERISEFS